MTVKELFDHFSNWFDKISYHTSPATTGEFGVIEDDNYEREESQAFLDKFGSYIVEHWEYINYDNSIYLLIKEKK